MSGFVDRFAISFGRVSPEPFVEEVMPPAWVGPPEGELGVVVPQSLVLARSEIGVVALRHLTVYSTGLTLDLVAAARGLRESQTNALFHEQHFGVDREEGLPDGFLRIGVEYADGRQATNLGGRHPFERHEGAPEEPVLFHAGGGGGSAGSGRVTMNPGYWLWPLPPVGMLRLFVEWPALQIELTAAELATEPLLGAVSRSEKLWVEPT